MITIAEYVGPHAQSPDWTAERASNALMLLQACDKLEADGGGRRGVPD
jgi:hypothetical protein